MNNMYKFLPFMTNDGSVGLYDEECNDIYHSAFGAVSEAYEKFVLPSLDIIGDTKRLKVLDICYGIGFNTKALITAALSSNIELNIDCVDSNRTLVTLSPFIKSKISKLDTFSKNKLLYKNIIQYPEGNKITKLYKNRNNKYNISNFANILLLKNLIKYLGLDFLSAYDEKLILEHDNLPFFDINSYKLYKFIAKKGVYLPSEIFLKRFVHNIYYKHISKQYKMYKNIEAISNIDINFSCSDIRRFIETSEEQYDIIFLDGFTPAKCPCLWSLELLTKLQRHTDGNGVLLTYNTSAPVHNALLKAGYYIGNTLDENNTVIGTIASKNKTFIKHPLSERQEGLLNTKAGIMYRDLNLNLDNGTILSNRKTDFDNSNLISSSKYLKGYNHEI